MITLPATFSELKFSAEQTGSFVVRIINGNGTSFRFSEKPIYGTGSTSEGLLYDISPVTHGFDYATLEYQPSRVSIILSNLWSGKSVFDHKYERLSDRMATTGTFGLWGQQVVVQWYPGGYEDTINGLELFLGRIVKIDVEGNDRLVIQADEIWNLGNTILPQRVATRTQFRNLPAENVGKSLPLVYGAHTEGAYLRSAGFATGLRVDSWTWLFADHESYAFYAEPRASSATNLAAYSSTTQSLWIYLSKVRSWARSYAGVTFNVADTTYGSTQTTATIDPDTSGWDVFLYPTSGVTTSTGTDSSNNVGASASFDYDDTTKLSVLANSTVQAEVTYTWDINGGPDGSANPDLTPAENAATNDLNNDVASFPGPGTALYGFDMYCSKPAGVTISSATIDYWSGSIWIALSASVDYTTTNMIHYTSAAFVGDVYGSPDSMRWHLSTGRSRESGTTPDQKPFKIRIRFNGSGWTANSTVVAYVHECRLVFSCKTPRDASTTINYKNIAHREKHKNLLGQWDGTYVWINERVAVTDIDTTIVGASVQGREYQSGWTGQHAAEPWAAGDQIVHAAGVIESILRDELGNTSSTTMDLDSFDTLYNASDPRGIVLNLKPGSRRHSKELIERICFEHDMVLYRGKKANASPQFRLVPATGRPTTAGIILRPELHRLPDIGVTEFRVKNKIRFWYRKLPHDGQFMKYAEYEDTTSSAEFGVLDDEVFLETIVSSTNLNPIRSRLIEDNYFASQPHYLVSFDTIGARWAALELGDLVEFDPNTLDPQLQLFGESWNGIQFIIYESSTHKRGCAFKAISKNPANI